MKLIIQIPCYNEEGTLATTLKDLPTRIEGVDEIEILVIDDGCEDKTVQVAKENGVHHILSLPQHGGLAVAFKKGLDRAIELGADIIVNTDGDNQYCGQDIPKLIVPILEKKAEMVIGSRDMETIKHFSLMKKILQRFGSHIVRKISMTDIPDTTSGFRAYSRDAAMRLNVFSSYTYTIETIIQAGRRGIAVTSVGIRTNEKLRESRLIKNIPVYIRRSIMTILRIYLMYEPLRTMSNIAAIFIICGGLLVFRFIYFYIASARSGHVQSLIIAAILITVGFGVMLLGFLGDIISANRKLSEDILYQLKKKS